MWGRPNEKRKQQYKGQQNCSPVIFKEDLEDIFGKRPFEKHDQIVVDSPKEIGAPSSEEEGTGSEIITKDDDLSL
jgi:hypothetical protein